MPKPLIALNPVCIKEFKTINGFRNCLKVVEMAAIETASENPSARCSTSVAGCWDSPHAPSTGKQRASVAVYIHDGGQGVPSMHVPCSLAPWPRPQASREGRLLPV